MSLRFAAATVCLLALLPAQNNQGGGRQGNAGGEAVEVGEVDVREEGRGRSKEEMLRGEKEAEMANLTPEERLARNVMHGASQYCRFITSLKPAKLLPGQTGLMTIAVVLQGHAVLPAPAQITLEPGQPGPYTLGGLSIRPADTGRIEKGYLGRPVYENYAILEVPVTLTNDAQLGKKTVLAVDLKFDLYDGTSAMPISRFMDRATYEVEVGSAPDPAVRGGAKPADVVTTNVSATAPGTAGAGTDAAAPPTTNVEPAKIQGAVAEPVTVADAPKVDPVVATTDSTPMVGDDGGMSLPVILGAAGLLAVVVLLLARKK